MADNDSAPAGRDASAHNDKPDQPSEVEYMCGEPPIVLVVGSEKEQLKACWDGAETNIELSDISVERFRVALKWMYAKALPDRLLVFKEECHDHYVFDHVRIAYKASDLLTMNDLQNALMDNLTRLVMQKGINCRVPTVQKMIDDDLSHTPLYKFVVRSAVKNVMDSRRAYSGFDDAFSDLSAEARGDILSEMVNWQEDPWDSRCSTKHCTFHIHTTTSDCSKA